MISERLFQFIWQFQYFNRNELRTVQGDNVRIIQPGRSNSNQGPDFTEARIEIGGNTWIGHVELHIRSSDWNRHQHQHDENYRNVILHVVWSNDVASPDTIPLLELKDRIPSILLQRYESLMNQLRFIPCGNMIRSVPDLTWTHWKTRLLFERLQKKSMKVRELLAQNNQHWEEVFWWMLARNFGMKINTDAFEAVARSIPISILARQKQQLHQLEALLLGQAGFLERRFEEAYPVMLQKEYRHQQFKHKLTPVVIPMHFLRMRPINFPTVRLAQLAMVIHRSSRLFTKVRDAKSVADITSLFSVTANDYWHYHYRFDEQSNYLPKPVGAAMIENIIINTIAPVLFTYSEFYGLDKLREKAIEWLEKTPAEKNRLTRQFLSYGVVAGNAVDSQALTQLYGGYCEGKRCLDCAVGKHLLSF